MMVETTRAFVKLKQNKVAVSAGGTKVFCLQRNRWHRTSATDSAHERQLQLQLVTPKTQSSAHVM
jgi:hypothetical protein